ncbi:MAG: ABC transporter ATP-binding protein [Chloroflexi bacterium]|nr:ABC transporter ATP-binding protein [Chloroflexota bacterium]
MSQVDRHLSGQASLATGAAPPARLGGAPSAGATIEFVGVAKRFWKGDTPVDAIGHVELVVRPGEFLGIVGPSGCGKSTLLNLAAGLMLPTAGEVRYQGHLVRDVNTRVGYMTQKDSLVPWRTVESNIALPLEIRGLRGRRKRELVAHYVELVGLKGFERHFPSELSGGMRKRVGLARTLVNDPETLLMDEPFGALDAQLRLLMHEETLRIWEHSRKTIIFVTHDLAEAVLLADRVVVISARPGRVKLIKDIDLPRPRDVARVRFDPRFGRLFEELWAALGEDVRRGDENR